MRGLGFLLGVGLTVALFLLLVEDVVRPVTDPPAVVAESGDAADPSLPALPDAAAPAPASEPLPAADPGVTQEQYREVTAARTAEDETPQPPEQSRKPGFERPAAGTPPTGLPEPAAAGRYLFWSPFRSEWAARGFATRLTSATAVPVAVIEEGRATYRVGFDYRDEAQRRERVARIETITGLELE
jgi:hypothetical protein